MVYGISLYYFLQLIVSLQLPQNEKFKKGKGDSECQDKVETKGLMEQVTLEQNHEGREGSNQEIIWGRASQEEETKE